MSLVSIDSLEVENFGPYYGKQVFHFTPLDGRSSILIGGKNGAGKAHLAARFVSCDSWVKPVGAISAH